jgi:hypothetical protein
MPAEMPVAVRARVRELLRVEFYDDFWRLVFAPLFGSNLRCFVFVLRAVIVFLRMRQFSTEKVSQSKKISLKIRETL